MSMASTVYIGSMQFLVTVEGPDHGVTCISFTGPYIVDLGVQMVAQKTFITY